MSVLHSESARRSPTEVIADLWNAWTRNPACPADLAACSADDVDRTARDIGLSGWELRQLARHWSDNAELLFRRMAALKLDPDEVAAADRATFQDLERLCTVCDCKGRCKRDLTNRPDDARWEDYCPNVATLKMLNALPWASRRAG
jgi:hypothetical protein